MGEVYRARDVKLNRDVALKVLPDAFASDPERLARFEREAHTLAALNHPNIAAIYGVEESSGVRALVMELVEGETLSERIAAGPVPIPEALAIARQIAVALEAAHEHGIIHRDLKPANVKATPEGVVKVLDFGLAKIADEPSTPGNPTLSPTLTLQATRAGVILGTAAYMSPEQARGAAADKRADIWAFGVVLFEMLTGRQSFPGETTSDILAGVLRAEPEWGALPAATPDGVRKLLKRCLERDRKQRLQAIGEARIAIDECLAHPEAPPGAPGARPKSRERVAWIVAALAAAVALTVATTHFREKPPEVRPVRFAVFPPDRAAFGNLSTAGAVMVSPDGAQLAFVGTGQGANSELWLRPLDALTAHPLAGTTGATYPFWSPDSRYLGFFADGKLKKVAANGGPPQTLCEAPSGRGGSWSRGKSSAELIVFAPNATGGLFVVSAAGGEPAAATTLDSVLQQNSHRQPEFLPDGRHFLFVATSSQPEKAAIFIGDIEGKPAPGSPKRLMAGDSRPLYSPPGYLLFVREKNLMAQPFDAGSLQFTGDIFPIVDHVASASLRNIGAFSVSAGGALVWGNESASPRHLTWLDRQGKQIAGLDVQEQYFFPQLSPDGRRAAFAKVDALNSKINVWLMDLVRSTASRFTFGSDLQTWAVWSPDGTRIVYSWSIGSVYDLYWKETSGVGAEELLLKSSENKRASDWSRDGRFILYVQNSPKTKLDLWVLPLFGDRKPFPILQTEFEEGEGHFSPDGRWIAYTSNESGRFEVYVRSFSGSPGAVAGKWQVSPSGGSQPRWRRDGRELFFRAADGKLMAAPIASGAAFQAGNPAALFDTRDTSAPFDQDFNVKFDFDVGADGQRFLVAAPLAGGSAQPVYVCLNWLAGLKH
jgi:Tol biopolymer transport system component